MNHLCCLPTSRSRHPPTDSDRQSTRCSRLFCFSKTRRPERSNCSHAPAVSPLPASLPGSAIKTESYAPSASLTSSSHRRQVPSTRTWFWTLGGKTHMRCVNDISKLCSFQRELRRKTRKHITAMLQIQQRPAWLNVSSKKKKIPQLPP